MDRDTQKENGSPQFPIAVISAAILVTFILLCWFLVYSYYAIKTLGANMAILGGFIVLILLVAAWIIIYKNIQQWKLSMEQALKLENQYRNEIKKAHDQLLQRVREQTAQLEQKNQEVKDANKKNFELHEELLITARQAAMAAEEASRTKTNFLANMSHELRTPLNSVIGLSEILLEDEIEADDKANVEQLQRIIKSSKHLLNLINAILDLSKIEAGKIEFVLEDFDLYLLIDEIKMQSESLLAKNANQLVVEADKSLGTMHADSVKLKQIIINLISNAGKFSEKSQVTLSVKKHNDFVEFKIMDKGIGISAKQMNKLFEAFSQADASITRKYGGAGLGLAITKKLTELMGGEVKVESEHGKGTIFTVTLPCIVKPNKSDKT
ncbi:MAG: hypothetical protein A3F14_02015 [Gammaproteobacteria bacterium RIFCSPHIGHO2_12_FULL_43_28]|nr:MAG: hypothetical protein A3F14_02015 [Gammaproteobacteria bacterium RIFCSPHIGHO2_12_FULL_43_28]